MDSETSGPQDTTVQNTNDDVLLVTEPTLIPVDSLVYPGESNLVNPSSKETAERTATSDEPESDKTDLERKYADLELQNADLKRQITDLKHDHTDLGHKYTDLEHRHTDLEHRHTDLEHRHTDLEHKYTASESSISDMKYKNSNLEDQLKQTQSDLKDTQALLGRAVLEASRKSPLSSSVISTAASKRSRSRSVETPPPAKKFKGKEKASETSIVEGSRSDNRGRLVPYVSVPPRKFKVSLQSPSEKSLLRNDMDGGLIGTSTGQSKDLPVDASVDLANTIKQSPSSPTSYRLRPLSQPMTPTKPKVARNFGKPEASKGQDVFSLPRSVTDIYLQDAKALAISPPALDLEISRRFLRETYGGSDQQFLQYIQPNKNPSGPVLRRLVFPMLNLNPSIPSAPGLPGLIFASRHEILSNPPWTVFCKRTTATPAVWLYVGDYVCTLVGTLTAEQFRAQSLVVQRKWAELIIKKKKYDVYVEMRARIVLRRDSLIPLVDKIIENELVRKEAQSIKNGKGRNVTEDQIISAFSNGDEGVDIIRMICVKYDHVFANDIKAQLDNLDSAAKKTKEEPSAESGTGRRNARDRKKSKAPVFESDSDVDSEPSTTSPEPSSPARTQRHRKASRKVLESMSR